MYRFLVIFAIVALASARVSILSIEFENALGGNRLDFEREKEILLPLLQRKNSSFALNEPSNEVTDVFTLAQLTAVPSKGKIEKTREYTFGKRVDNDRMVGYASDVKTWDSPQDVTLNLKYPESGNGATVTFVQIIVGQSSELGDAKVTGGGVGQHSIALVVTAQKTLWFTYVVYYYGM